MGSNEVYKEGKCMTKEELKEHCKKQIERYEFWAKARGENPCGKIYEEHKLILELLEQEPCEDCISRQAVLDYLDKMPSELTSDGRRMVRRRTLEEYISDTLPSVTPQPKVGRWINIDATHSKCDRCGAVFEIASENGESNYCPHCGAKMEEK
jgi:ribosomal protein L37E